MNAYSRSKTWSLLDQIAALTLIGGAWTTQAQTPPYPLFQYSSLTGSGNTISVTRVPVVVAPGVTLFVNLVMQFDVDSSGNLTISAGYPQTNPAPVLLTSSIVSGKYVGPSTINSGKALINVSGPGIADAGATEWSSAAASGADDCTFPGTAAWYVGPISSSPYAERLKSAGITSTAWSYGVSTSKACTANWQTDTLIGVSQVGDTITFVSFTRSGEGGSDNNTPRDQITYKLVP